ncbi:MAG: hypothetical protein DI528_18510 [Shinella sp.]|nr:MAG: hypothetical protein DI528_18510 [Shinella sp.]
MRTIKTRTPEEKLLGIARASQLLGDVATARAALDRLSAVTVPDQLAPEIARVAKLVADDYEREKPLGEGALLDLDHLFVKLGISRGRYPSAVLETARRYRSAAQPAA